MHRGRERRKRKGPVLSHLAHPAAIAPFPPEHETIPRGKEREVNMAREVVVRSVPGERFTQEVETGKHRLLGDEPVASGGADRGPGPYEYLLAALGT